MLCAVSKTKRCEEHYLYSNDEGPEPIQGCIIGRLIIYMRSSRPPEPLPFELVRALSNNMSFAHHRRMHMNGKEISLLRPEKRIIREMAP